MDHAPSMWQMRNAHKVSAAKSERKISLENKRRCEDNLKSILDKYGVRMGLGSSGLRYGPVAGGWENGSESSGSNKIHGFS